MKMPPFICQCAAFALVLGITGIAEGASLEIVSSAETRCFFSGDNRVITVLFHNPTDTNLDVELKTRLYQASSSTAIFLGEAPWKRLSILAGQTVIESATLNFPQVRAETPFLIQWLDYTNRVIGKTEVLVYPTDLLAELKTLAGGSPLGVVDPGNQLKPLLKMVAIDFVDLENNGLEHFTGRLAIIGPFLSASQMETALGKRIKKMARNGKAVVWILPAPAPHEKIQPSFSVVPEETGGVVVAQAEMVSNLAENPRAQLNLIHFSRLALQPEPPRLPEIGQP